MTWRIFCVGGSRNWHRSKECFEGFPANLCSLSRPNSLFARLGDRLMTADSENVETERAREENRRKNVDIADRTRRESCWTYKNMRAKKNVLIKRRYLRFTKMWAKFNRGNKIVSHSEWDENVFLNSRLLMMHLKSSKTIASAIDPLDWSEKIQFSWLFEGKCIDRSRDFCGSSFSSWGSCWWPLQASSKTFVDRDRSQHQILIV